MVISSVNDKGQNLTATHAGMVNIFIQSDQWLGSPNGLSSGQRNHPMSSQKKEM